MLLCHVGNAREGLQSHADAGRIAGGVDDDGLGAGCDFGLNVGRRHLKAVFGGSRYTDRYAAHHLDLVGIGGIVGLNEQHFIALIDDGLQR
ncbi:hypothetical protein SDC9_143117 [bioreactor metagenome]|uniref:Uncharacterized protein n=1 Tax=bioreactor metagenome TaxID=1076179 RepID=A0A645E323_9ZZZZ